MKDAVVVALLSLLPRNHASWGMGWLARWGLSRWGIRAFVAAYGVDTTEMDGSLADYRTLEDFFTRKLKGGARPIDPAENALVSPVDGTYAVGGQTREGRIEVAPGRWLVLSELLGTPIAGERDVAVLYLAPRNYHRVHVPREGTATGWRYVPGTLWPVFPAAVRRVDGLFARNERLIVYFDTSAGPLTVVLVGAFGVGRIESRVCDVWANTGLAASEGRTALAMGRGDELGVFHLGSTVVLVALPGKWRFTVAPGAPVRMGQRIAERV